MLRMNEIELELISDTDMHLFIEKGMRGGISKKGIVKQIISTCNHIMFMNQVNLLHIWIQIIYMVGQ